MHKGLQNPNQALKSFKGPCNTFDLNYKNFAVGIWRDFVHTMCMYCRSLFVLYVVLFSFSHCIVWPSSIYGFWLPLWYLQTLLSLCLPHVLYIYAQCGVLIFELFKVMNNNTRVDSQALDRWTLISPCLPRWYVFSGLVTM